MGNCKAPLAVFFVVCIASCRQGEAQLLANIKSVINNIPTFGSQDVPKFSTDGQYALSPRQMRCPTNLLCIRQGICHVAWRL